MRSRAGPSTARGRRNMSMRRLLVGAALTLAPGAVLADGPGLGQPVAEADLVLWDISIAPDGRGLPPGSATSAEGAAIFATKCAGMHGGEAKGGPNGALVGG